MTDEVMVVLAIALLLLVGVAGIWLILFLARNSGATALMRRRTPAPRARHPQVRFSGTQLADWQASVGAAAVVDPAVPAHIGPHLLSVTDSRAILRSGGDAGRRMILFLFVILPLMAVSLMVTLKAMVDFFVSPAHRSYLREVVTDGGTQPRFETYAPTIGNYFRSLGDGFGNYFSDRAIANWGGTWAAFRAFLFSTPFFLAMLLVLLVVLAVLVLRRTDAPLVFDRRRQLVYTLRRGRIYAAPWKGMQMTVARTGRNTAPAFALGEAKQPERQRWFALAAWNSFREDTGEFPDGGHDVYARDRWQGMHHWLTAYMSGKMQAAEQPRPQFGLMRLLTPVEGKLPDDIEARLDAARPALSR